MECPKNTNIQETERIFEAGENCCSGCQEFCYDSAIAQCKILETKEDN